MATTITIQTPNGDSHDFTVVNIGSGQWGINHPSTGQAAGRAHRTDNGWAAYLQNEKDGEANHDTLLTDTHPDELRAVYAVAHAYAAAYLTPANAA